MLQELDDIIKVGVSPPHQAMCVGGCVPNHTTVVHFTLC